MVNVILNNDSLCEAAQRLGHHETIQETIENALKLYIEHLQQFNSNDNNFFSCAGLWKNRDITLESLRQQAWKEK